jgi:hypothetical protein
MSARYFPVLLMLLAACSHRAEQPKTILHSVSALVTGNLGATVPPSGPLTQDGSQTLLWSDSTSRGDTALFIRGRVITTNLVLVDSQWMRITPPPITPGIPLGLFGLWDGTRLKPNTEMFTMTYGGESPATLLARLAIARSRGVKMVTAMTGGARANYLTDGAFDMAKWKARMNRFDRPEIRVAVAQAVSEGILIGNSVMDEPFNEGGPGNEANGWGPRGTMYKARVDSMCGYAKAMFPTLPQGVFHDYTLEPDGSYKVCDFITSQYRVAKGPLTDYRDGALALCGRDRHACSFALNVLDGGIRAKKTRGQTDYAPGDCPLTTTGGRGTYFPNCRMTAEQVREAGRVLGSAGCFLTGFRYDYAFMANAENQQAFWDVIATLATKPSTSCIRR